MNNLIFDKKKLMKHFILKKNEGQENLGPKKIDYM